MDQLWTSADERALDALLEAVERGDLFDAMMAVEGADRADRIRTRRRISAWAEMVAAHDAFAETPARAMAAVLGAQEDLHGDVSDYYAPRNSYLSVVVERRRGLPILLSIVWQLVGEALGVTVEGVGLPGHFVVRVGGEDGALCDPFSAGAGLDRETCQRLVERLKGVTWSDAYLEARSSGEIVERVLRNLVHAFERDSDSASSYRAARKIAGLRPDSATAQLLHIRAAQTVGAFDIAERACRDVEARFPDSDAALVAAGWRHKIVAQRPLLN